MGKGRHKNRTKINIPIRVAAVLLCLTLFSNYLVTGLYARYATSALSSDDARVAKFSVDSALESDGVITESIEASFAPGGSKTATLIVENNSETAVEYTVNVANVTKNLPLSFRLESMGGSPAVATNGTSFTVRQIAGNHTDRYTLYIDWLKHDDDLTRIGMVDYITVTVTAAQMD